MVPQLEAMEFRKFWGEKSEMRRFGDGRINEAVVWEREMSDARAVIDADHNVSTGPGDHPVTPVVLALVSDFVLQRHCTEEKEEITTRWLGAECLLSATECKRDRSVWQRVCLDPKITVFTHSPYYWSHYSYYSPHVHSPSLRCSPWCLPRSVAANGWLWRSEKGWNRRLRNWSRRFVL